MTNVLLCWLGDADLRGIGIELPARPRPKATSTGGPIAKAVESRCYDRIVLFNNRGKAVAKPYREWLTKHTGAEIQYSEGSCK